LPTEARYVDRVRRELGVSLAQGEPSLGQVAKRLAVSERTLHRRLAEEDARFAELLDDARRERALLLLGDPARSGSEIAGLLGYGEPSAFFRAFRRWTGETPRAYRLRAVVG
jgi:AraC-like DNA-binding protein